MAGVGPGDLWLLASDYLQACVEALDTLPTSPDLAPGFVGSPARAFIAPGTPVADCDQLTVHTRLIQGGPQAPGPDVASTFRKNYVTLVATLFRCAALTGRDGTAPTSADLEAISEQVLADRWALWNYTWNKVNAHLLFEKCAAVFNWQLDQLPPSGNIVGTTLTVTVELEGYESTFGT